MNISGPKRVAIRRLVMEAADTGTVPDNSDAVSEGIPTHVWLEFKRIATIAAAITMAGKSNLATRYASDELEIKFDALDALDAAFDDLGRPHHIDPSKTVAAAATVWTGEPVADGRPDGPAPTLDPNHLAIAVLNEVALGRPAPTVAQLTAAGWPADIAEPTNEAARIVAALSQAGYPYAREVAHSRGRRIATEHPWPAPTDDWSDLAARTPPSTLSQQIDRGEVTPSGEVDVDDVVATMYRSGFAVTGNRRGAT